MKPPIPYFGGKGSTAQRIAQLLPPHGHYVEPFAGSLAVLLAKPRSKMETVNDIDEHLMTFWRTLRDRPYDLASKCAATPHSRREYVESRELPGDSDMETARRVWVQLSQGRSGTLRRTGWRYFIDRSGSSIGMPHYLHAYVERLIDAADRIAGVTLECKPALDLIRDYGRYADTLIYADPPYLAQTRAGASNYRCEMPTEHQHRELASALHDCESIVVLSGYASDLYDLDLYADWHRIEIDVFNGNAGGDGKRTEVLWSNRPLLAHDHLFAVAGESA